MARVRARVNGCYDQFKVAGMVTVSVTVAKTGRVQSATISGPFAGTPTGDCVAKAVRSASFPPFKSASQTFQYPYVLR